MTWSLIKDTLEFARRHWLVLLILLLPIQLVLVGLNEFININAYFDEFISEKESIEVSPDLETETSPRAETQTVKPKLEFFKAPDISTIVLCSLYFIFWYMPMALVIEYTHAVRTSDSTQIGVLYRRALFLNFKLLKYYLFVWGTLLPVFIFLGLSHWFGFSVFLGFPGFPYLLFKTLSMVVITLLAAYWILVYLRLILGTYYLRDQEVTIMESIKWSWYNSRSFVLNILLGSILLSIPFIVFNTIFQVIFPSGNNILVNIILAIVDEVLITVFYFRVYDLSNHEEVVEGH